MPMLQEKPRTDIEIQILKPGLTFPHLYSSHSLLKAFYKEYLWAMPINGRKVDELNLREVASENS
jgi:hypothetical protein